VLEAPAAPQPLAAWRRGETPSIPRGLHEVAAPGAEGTRAADKVTAYVPPGL
jgi:hypothetical protein